MDSDSDADDSISHATYLVKKVFDEVCEEFRLWKEDYASRILHSVARPPSRDGSISNRETPALSFPEPTETPPLPSPTLEYIEVLDYGTGKTVQAPMKVFRVTDAFSAPPPLPAHEYWTPSLRSISVGDDPSELPFMPFPDDPAFNHADFLEEYTNFGWRTSMLDPDCNILL